MQKSFSDEDIKKIFSNYHREDSPISIKRHLALLTQVGFTSVDVLWKIYNFSVYVGVKER